ncbi:single-stranded DNA-binding protein [Helicovermis profundi]|uniref:Single-stranded DNA-binding protein n=1 Tax=Helicovermis profundi TaxID=3065157 RepID=A0AAU9EQN5_9FIRM|nr:single-stranded DNA-binding protein [Clostridia bacterium S502]
MNSVVLIGRLTRDPELRFIAGSGRAVANFTLAVNKNLSKEKKREFEEKGIATADFIRIVVWGKQAENCANYLSKGRLVAINGYISTSSYKTNTGETRYSTDILANNVEFLEWKDKKTKKDDFSYGAEPDNFQSVEDDDIPF